MGETVKGIEKLPDAGIYWKEFTDDKISVDIQINDLILTEYHRDNGFSKVSFKIVDPKDLKKFFETEQGKKKL